MSRLSNLINDYKSLRMNENIEYIRTFNKDNYPYFDSFLRISLASFPIYKWFPNFNEEAKESIRHLYFLLRSNEQNLSSMNSFDQIIDFIDSANINNFEDISVYDTSLALGVYFNQMPKKIFLHSAPRTAIRKLFGMSYNNKIKYLNNNRNLMYIEQNDLPKEFNDLDSYLVTNCLTYIYGEI